MRHIVFAFAIFFTASVSAQEYMPFPEAHITEKQWNTYFAEVKKMHGASQRDFPDEHLVVYDDRDAGLFWAFTTPGHAAHPAWITRRVLEQAGEVSTTQIGYFAGNEPAFAKLFNDYLALTEKTVKNLQKSGSNELVAPKISFAQAEKMVRQSKQKPGYAEFLSEFSQHNNRHKLDSKSGCYLLTGKKIKLILILNDKAVESAVADVDNEKAQCFKRIYVGAEMPKPPHTPFAMELIIK